MESFNDPAIDNIDVDNIDVDNLDVDNLDIPDNNIMPPLNELPTQSSPTIETNMIYLNNHINELQAKYLLLDAKVTKLQDDTTKVTEQQDVAGELVGDAPFKLDTTS